MADYTSGSINFAGLGNGTDFNTLIDKLIGVEQKRVTRLEKWKSSWETKKGQFKDLNTALLGLKTTLEGFDSMNKFMSKAVSTSNTDLLTASGNANALESTHRVEINQLATNDILITTSGANALTASVTSSNTDFTFSYGGTSYTINDIAAGTTLEGFVNIINNHPKSRSLIQASTIFDGSTYHLQLSGKGLGADNQLIISNAGSLIFDASSYTQTQNAQNSQIRVDGFPASSSEWLERASNTVDDVISGVTLNLKQAWPGATVDLTVTTDTSVMADNITTFVDEINEIRARIIALTAVDEDGEGSILTGNYGVDIISQNLKNITAEMGLGFTPWDEKTGEGDRYSALSQLGILTDAEQGSETYGLLVIDYNALNEALAKDPSSVAQLFAADATGESKTSDFSFNSLITGTTKAGTYDIEVVSDGTKIVSATINGEEAKVSGWDVTGLKGDATGLAFSLSSTDAGTYSGEISVKVGKTGEMVEELKELTRPFNKFTFEGGPLSVLQNNYGDIIDSINEKIAFEQTRINKMETTLREKYSRLDALLGQYELRQGQLETSLAQLK